MTEDSTPLDILEIFFNTELLKVYRMKWKDVYTLEEESTLARLFAHFEGVCSFMFISKETPTNMK
jgi:hypothetical protein